MKKTSFVASLLLAVAGTASAGGQEGTVGVGAEFQLSGAGGASLNYDAGAFHVGGFLGYTDPANGTDAGDDEADVLAGARFFYHVHSTAMSDLGVGGGLGLIRDGYDTATGDDAAWLVYLEPSIQIRIFLASNVALSFTTGVSLGLVDAADPAPGPYNDGVSIGGQVTATGGVHYYFF